MRTIIDQDESLFEAIESSVHALNQSKSSERSAAFGDWEGRFLDEPKKFMTEDGHIQREGLRNFRGKHIFVADRPAASFRKFYHSSQWFHQLMRIVNVISGQRRGGIREALDIFDVVKKENYLHLLKKYPTPSVGRPMTLVREGCEFTFRYIRHIHSLGLFLEHLRNKLKDDAVVLDIGSSYGIFSSLIKQEMPKSRHVLVDLSGQLVLAHYYLASLFPNAKIAGFSEVAKTQAIDRQFIEGYDFVLVPTDMFDKLSAGSVDLATNFISFFEMSRDWYFKYIESPVFRSASYVFTANRYDAYPTYHNNLTFLDFPFADFETIYIRTCPFLRFYYQSFLFFWYKQVQYPSQFFQFIGRRVH